MSRIALWLSLAFVFTIPWENMILMESLGTVGRAMGLLLAAFWLVVVFIKGRFRKPHPFHIAALLFLLWNIISVFWSVDVDKTMDRLLTYAQLIGLVYILWDLYTSRTALAAALQAYVLGAYVSVGGTLVNYLTGGDDSPARLAATGFNENDLGLILALGIPLAWYLALSETDSRWAKLLRPVNYAYLPAALVGLVLTASRGAMVAALPAFLFVIGSAMRLKPYVRLLAFVALTGSLFVLQPLVPRASLERLSTTGASIAEGDLTGRVEIWQEGLAALSERPLTGYGSGAFRAAVDSGKVAHNVFVSVLVEVGPVGFVLFVLILGIAAYEAARQPKWESRLWLAALVVWTLGATVHTWEQRKPTWLFFSFAIISASLPLRQREAAEMAARPPPEARPEPFRS